LANCGERMSELHCLTGEITYELLRSAREAWPRIEWSLW